MKPTAQPEPARHTPGPYFIDDGMIPMDAQADLIRDAIGTPEEWTCIGPGDEDDADRPACVVALCHPQNAPLLAAAPDLLSVLKEMCDGWPAQKPDSPHFNTYNKARETIARAEGRP